MPLKSKNGKLLSSNGHLCTTCCNSCTNPWSWTNAVLNGTVFSQSTAQNIRFTFQDSENCGGSNPYTQFGWAECCAIAPFDGYLRIFAAGHVETQNVGFEVLSVSINDRQVLYGASFLNDGGCGMDSAVVSSDVPVSAGDLLLIYVSTTTGDGNYHIGAFWEVAFNWALPVGSMRTPPMSPPFLMQERMPISKARFEICKGCAESLESGFACRLYSGCCLGNRRADPTFHCPANKW